MESSGNWGCIALLIALAVGYAVIGILWLAIGLTSALWYGIAMAFGAVLGVFVAARR